MDRRISPSKGTEQGEGWKVKAETKILNRRYLQPQEQS